MKKRVILNLYFALTIVCLLVIFYLSVIPGQIIDVGVAGFDKVKHFLIYLFFSWLIYKSTNKAWLAGFLAGTYGLLLEIIQFILPHRSFSLGDIVVNYLAGLFLIIIVLCRVGDSQTL